MSETRQRAVRRAIRRLLVSLGIAAVLALLSLFWSRKRLNRTPETTTGTTIGTTTPLPVPVVPIGTPPLPVPDRRQAEHCCSSASAATSAAPTEEAPAASRKRWQAAALLTQTPCGARQHEGGASSESHSPETKKKFAAFVSHMKAEASMEARFVQGELETAFGQRIFLDSDDLRTLSDLTTHVRESDVLVLVQSKSVLTRPYCLLELLTACQHGVPIVGVCLSKHSFPYDFNEAHAFLSDLDETLATAAPGAHELLREHGIHDLAEAAYLLSCCIPKIISVHLDTCASRNMLKATIADLVATINL